jgi:hypothetical protein
VSIFYDIFNKSYEEQVEIIKEAKLNCYLWQHDILDCTKSFSRQNMITSDIRQNEPSFNEIMKHFKEGSGCHVVFIDRQGYGTWGKKECWEIGFCTMNKGIDHFLFIHIEPQIAHDLIEKYRLKRQV